jgi:tetratricopeptide (TPR) repeat protein
MTMNKIEEAIQLSRRGEFLPALGRFLEIYGTENAPPLNNPKAAAGLSYFGLCLALVQKKYRPAIELCRRALDLEFYNGDHYVNLARVYLAAGQRKKALDIAESGLRLLSDHDDLQRVRRSLGVRARPPVPFLDRSHPINVTLGQARHAKKVPEPEKRKK